MARGIQENVLIVSHWRTGSNLLITIFKEHGVDYVDFNEYYSLTGLWAVDDTDKAEELKGISNNYLISHIYNQLGSCTLKVNYPHYHFLTSEVITNFPYKFLLYRRDLFAVTISRIIAITRQNFCAYRSHGRYVQPRFNQAIPREQFIEYLVDCIEQHEKYCARDYDSEVIDHVVNFEDDLVPYHETRRTVMIPSNNYKVQNIDELQALYAPYKNRVNRVIAKYDALRLTNKTSFTDYMENILKANNEQQ